MSALDDVIKWAEQDIPNWQSDAVRRFLTQDELKEEDILEILEMLKEKHGITNPKTSAPKPQPLSKGKISGSFKQNTQVTLKNMCNLAHINAIPDNSYIPFAHEGLTVIYGENGAGKSGYARVLKRACNARDTKEMIHPNICESTPTTPASATFKVSIDCGPDQDVNWTDGQKDEILANITVFDAKSARVIVDEDTGLRFIPYGTQVFKQLVDLLKQLRTKLADQGPRPIILEFEDIPIVTKAGQDLSAISSKTTIAELDKITAWNDEAKLRLNKIVLRIGELESPDLKKKIQRLYNLENLAKTLAGDIKVIDETLSVSTYERLKKLIAELKTAETAFSLAIKQTDRDEPLPGVGSEVWQSLYFAAREYSIKEAYQGQSFPVVNDNSRCVFCMQPLLQEGKDRFSRFKEFMEQTAKKSLEKVQFELETYMSQIKLCNFDHLNLTNDLIQEMCYRNDSLSTCITTYVTATQARLQQFINAIEKKLFSACSEIQGSPFINIQNMQTVFAAEARKLEEGLNPEELKNLKIERKELEARESLSKKKIILEKQILELQLADKYSSAVADTDFTAISLKGKDIISRSITPELQNSLVNELKALGADYLMIDFKSIGSGGELKNKLTMRKAKLPGKAVLTDILSEGEQRVVAIASFMAELEIAKHKCPIVFDDPVCSLDHIFRDKIAERLAKEAKNRQVIVFTHDIAFLLGLNSYSAEFGAMMSSQTIYRHGDAPGRSAEGMPWHTMNTKERIGYLKKRLDKFKDIYITDKENYNSSASVFYGLMRDAWEAVVEQDLLNNTINPHAPGVHTKSLKSVEVTTEQYKVIDFSMAKCSRWMTGHKASGAIDVNLPSPEECAKDIEKLSVFRNEINKRQQPLRDEREKALKPQSSALG